MTALTVTAAQVGLVDPLKAVTFNGIASETITKGQACYAVVATGKVGVADANTFGKEQFRGIALNAAGAGQAVTLVQEGDVYGFTLTNIGYDGIAYLSDTAGSLDDAAGTMAVWCGRVVALADKDLTKVLRVFVKRDGNWA